VFFFSHQRECASCRPLFVKLYACLNRVVFKEKRSEHLTGSYISLPLSLRTIEDLIFKGFSQSLPPSSSLTSLSDQLSPCRLPLLLMSFYFFLLNPLSTAPFLFSTKLIPLKICDAPPRDFLLLPALPNFLPSENGNSPCFFVMSIPSTLRL